LFCRNSLKYLKQVKMVYSDIIEIVNYQINLYNIETLLTKHLELTNKVTSLQPNMECHLFILNCSPILLNLENRLLTSIWRTEQSNNVLILLKCF